MIYQTRIFNQTVYQSLPWFLRCQINQYWVLHFVTSLTSVLVLDCVRNDQGAMGLLGLYHPFWLVLYVTHFLRRLGGTLYQRILRDSRELQRLDDAAILAGVIITQIVALLAEVSNLGINQFLAVMCLLQLLINGSISRFALLIPYAINNLIMKPYIMEKCRYNWGSRWFWTRWLHL